MAKKNLTNVKTKSMQTVEAHIAKRAAENRSKCLNCGMSDAACTRRVFKLGGPCCSTCGYTDTHPKPESKSDSEPCARCHGSGIEPHPDE